MNKGVLAVLVVFFGFWMFTDPHGLADFTQATGDSVGGWGQQLFSSLIEFLGDL
ncbi:hypothetical protein [Nocardioides halotolerans]|jgi:hypothetical protein|uniref:hypothetical protein n=1 Tax=Nocardioides halotolerans TaxID=433660 RepID=UPI00040F4989|nr:hypothetical protein [Nocardioides halotolerans]